MGSSVASDMQEVRLDNFERSSLAFPMKKKTIKKITVCM